jgi:hypothetical protein
MDFQRCFCRRFFGLRYAHAVFRIPNFPLAQDRVPKTNSLHDSPPHEGSKPACNLFTRSQGRKMGVSKPMQVRRFEEEAAAGR